MNKILLIDIGGTNIRYAFAEDGFNHLDSTKKIPLDTIDNFHTFVSDIVNSKNIDKDFDVCRDKIKMFTADFKKKYFNDENINIDIMY